LRHHISLAQPQKYRASRPRSATHNSDSSNAAAVDHAKAGDNHTHQEGKGEFWSAKLTDWLLAVLTGLLVLFTYRLWKSTERLWLAGEKQIEVAGSAAVAAKKSADVAESTLIATQRPWIEITGMRALSDLTFDADGGRVTIQAGIKVSGQTPALNVSVSGLFFVMGPAGIDALELQRWHCDEVRNRPVFASGPPMFPSGPNGLSISIPISNEHIESNALPAEFLKLAGGTLGNK
jgi:hypothetical protein